MQAAATVVPAGPAIHGGTMMMAPPNDDQQQQPPAPVAKPKRIDYYKQEWLTDELRAQVLGAGPCPSDFDEAGNVKDLAKVQALGAKVFTVDRVFRNIYQLKQAMNLFAEAWGFVVNVEGWRIHCLYRRPPFPRDYPKNVPNAEQVCNCPFFVKATPVSKQRNQVRIEAQIKIVQVNLLHTCTLCIPPELDSGSESSVEDMEAIKASGGYIKQEWLTDEIRQEVQAAWPSEDDFDEEGYVKDVNKLAEATAKVFAISRVFRNIYQLKQAVDLFSSKWGFKVNTAGWKIDCFYKADPIETPSKVSPDKQRRKRRSTVLRASCNCQFTLRLSPVKGREKGRVKTVARVKTPVKITAATLCHDCRPRVVPDTPEGQGSDQRVTGPKVDHYAEQWLTEELRTEIQAVWPTVDDLDQDGNVIDVNSIAVAAAKVFLLKREFLNFFQLKQAVDLFASKWGFKAVVQGWTVGCYYREPNRMRPSQVPPHKRRKRGSDPTKSCNCPFLIKTTNLNRELDRVGSRVRIAGLNLQHTCNPSATARAAADWKCGVFARKVYNMQDVVQYVQQNKVSSVQLRQMLRPYVDSRMPITSHFVANFRAKARRMLEKEGSNAATASTVRTHPMALAASPGHMGGLAPGHAPANSNAATTGVARAPTAYAAAPSTYDDSDDDGFGADAPDAFHEDDIELPPLSELTGKPAAVSRNSVAASSTAVGGHDQFVWLAQAISTAVEGRPHESAAALRAMTQIHDMVLGRQEQSVAQQLLQGTQNRFRATSQNERRL